MDHEAARDRLAERLARREELSEATVEAIRSVPRHEFVPPAQQSAAYDDRPLPIGRDQTISAPHMVAVMTELLDAERGDRVLEIGTGCGYHAAVTAELVGDGNVYSVEYHDELAGSARERLDRLGYEVGVRVGDGREGWPGHAPYDAAYLTCAARELPPAVVEQVREGGTALAPIGETRQELIRARVGPDGVAERERHGGVRFVTMR